MTWRRDVRTGAVQPEEGLGGTHQTWWKGSEDRVFWRVHGKKSGGNGQKLEHGMFIMRMVKHWTTLHSKVVGSPSLEVSALSWEIPWTTLSVWTSFDQGLGTWWSLEIPSNLNYCDSMNDHFLLKSSAMFMIPEALGCLTAPTVEVTHSLPTFV